ncbi:MAG: hypothetical protein C4516_02550 [Oxalobacter sp.]|nr:MAG: hypothetical protein C4516_02550 [Oxalobacter sp.]
MRNWVKTMARHNQTPNINQTGFSLIEMMVGLAIGMIVVLVIAQTLVGFEGQKRTTSGSADAQTGGSIATFTIQRQLQMAGYGVPIFSTNGSPINCSNSTAAVDHDGDGGAADPDPSDAAAVALTPSINISPVVIVDGGVAGNDSITIGRALGDVAGLPVKIEDFSTLVTNGNVRALNNRGCRSNDVAVITDSTGSTCVYRRVAGPPNPLPSQDNVKQQCETTMRTGGLVNETTLPDECKDIYLFPRDATGIPSGDIYISCPGEWLSVTYRVVGSNLEERTGSSSTGTTTRIIMTNVVGLQAQYGIAATPQQLPVSAWVDAQGIWAAPTATLRNRIRAVRLVIVARNDQLERQVVTSPGCNAAGACAWDGHDPTVDGDNNAIVDLSVLGGANWNLYRYRTFETAVSLRNMTWSSGVNGTLK